MRWVSRLTTIAVIAAVVGVAVFFVRGRMPDPTIGERFHTWAKFRDGSRLVPGSPVVIAGVRIGDIERVTISGRFARIDMRLRDDVEIPADSFITRRADSLFGDSYLEIIPPAHEEGAEVRMLRSGEPIVHVVEGTSTDELLRAMDRSLPKIENALEVVYDVMSNGRKFISGPATEKLLEADRWIAAGHVESPISSARDAMIRLEEMTSRGAAAMTDSSAEVTRTLARIDGAVADARAKIGDAQSSLITGFADARAGLDRVDEPLRKAGEVMAAIESGEGEDWKGTLGRLVSDDELVDDIEDVVSAGREGVAGFNRFRSWLGARIELNAFSRIARFYAIAEIRGRTDKFYLIELERGPLGGAPSDQLSDVAGTSAYLRQQEIRDELRFTAQFGKQLGPLALRAGIKESTPGLGADLLLLDGRLKFSADLFGSFQHTPRLKLAGAFAVFRSLYIVAGVDDVLNDPQYLDVRTGNVDVPQWFDEVRIGRDYFIGGALHFDDADLATLLRIYGAVLAGALAF